MGKTTETNISMATESQYLTAHWNNQLTKTFSVRDKIGKTLYYK